MSAAPVELVELVEMVEMVELGEAESGEFCEIGEAAGDGDWAEAKEPVIVARTRKKKAKKLLIENISFSRFTLNFPIIIWRRAR